MGGREDLLLSCPACVLNWEHLVGSCMKQNTGLNGLSFDPAGLLTSVELDHIYTPDNVVIIIKNSVSHALRYIAQVFGKENQISPSWPELLVNLFEFSIAES